MGIPLRVLIVEDVEDDAELLVQELRSKGYDPLYERVDTRRAMLDALERQTWDIIICDYSMPGFSAISAMALKRKIQNDLPLILISGTIGEDVAVEAMKAGADDYIMKDNLTRLVSAVKRELKEFENRRKLKRMEDAIQTLVKGTVGVTGQEFFDRIVRSVCEWLDADYAFIGLIVDGNKIKTLSAKVDREIRCDCIHDIAGTVCEHVIKDGYCVYAGGTSKLFSLNCEHLAKIKIEEYIGIALQDKNDKPIGVLWAVSRNKLDMPPRAREVMEIIATKAASEIERMCVEEELQESEQHYRKLLNSLKEGVYQCEPHVDGVFTWVNQACAEIFGYESPEEMTGTKVGDIYVYPEDRGRLMEKLEKYEVWRNFESVCKKRNGEQIYTERTSNMIRDEKGKPDCIEGVIRDITERKEMEESLRKSEDEIKASLREKEVLLKEIHHRVKNNMQVISSLLSLQTESIEDENIRQIIKKSHDRIKSMALIHEKLYQTKDFSRIDFSEYTRSLTARLLHSFGDHTNGVQLVIDMDEIFIDVNKAVPCGLIINEVVSNSFKHAFPVCTTGVDKNKFKGKGIIKISMRRNPWPRPQGGSHQGRPKSLAQTAGRQSASAEIAPGQAEIIKLVISDNGIGLPEGLDFRNTKTLGLELVNTLVGQLGGSIEHVNSKDGPEFKITFKV